MGPLFHFTANFLFVWVVAQILGVEFSGAVFILAMVGGLFPDFTHHFWEFVLAALVSFCAAYVFAFNRTGEAWPAFALGLLAIAALVFVRLNTSGSGMYKRTPREQWNTEMWKQTRLTYSVPYYVAFGLAAWLFTNDLAVGIIAFLCYALHGTIDFITYGTGFGLRNMAPYNHI